MRYLASILGLLTGLLSASCVSEDVPPVHLKIEYQLRCHPDHGCSGLPDEPAHTISGLDGQEGLDLDCQLGEKIGNISFSAAAEGYSLSLNPGGLEDTDQKCVLLIEEANNLLEKKCRVREGGTAECHGDDLDANFPCQVAIERDGDSVSGTLCCRNIPLQGKIPKARDLSLLGRNTLTKPGHFEIEHCR